MVSVLHQASYLRKKELVALDSGKQTTVGSGGFLFAGSRLRAAKKDLKKILNHSMKIFVL
ncbi:hypothetical protein CQA91_28535 [Shigella flexneri]|nr:hypothetical protein CQA91_28535 [Shigella flexneri]